jgi:DNA-binding LytR/AlgR family response regulator
MYKICICTEELELNTLIKNTTTNYFKKNNFSLATKIFLSGEELCSALKKDFKFDLIFLKTKFKTMLGGDVAYYIRSILHDVTTEIVFLGEKTSYSGNIFDLQILGYIPNNITSRKIENKISIFLKKLNSINSRLYFKFTSNNTSKNILTKNIICFKSINRSIFMITKNSEYQLHLSLKKILENICDKNIVQINRSEIINLEHIEFIQGNEIILSNKDIVYVSKTYQNNFDKLFFSAL